MRTPKDVLQRAGRQSLVLLGPNPKGITEPIHLINSLGCVPIPGQSTWTVSMLILRQRGDLFLKIVGGGFQNQEIFVS